MKKTADAGAAAVVSEIAGGVRLRVHAQPGAKRSEIVGAYGDAVKIRVQAPPVDGKANDEITRFLADRFGVARSSVRLTKGETNRAKVFEIDGISIAHAKHALGLDG